MSLATAWSNASATRTRTAWLLAATPILLLLAHYAAVLPHEFAHSFVAWFLDIKPNPLIIDWGGSSILNFLLLIYILALMWHRMVMADSPRPLPLPGRRDRDERGRGRVPREMTEQTG